MTDKERITGKERITEILKAYTKKNNISASSVILEEYAEELVRQGVIVPPVRYGDEIYYLFPQQGIQRAFVRRIQIGKYGVAICTKYGATLISEIGKTVFLTKEEAEKALAVRSGNNVNL